MMGFLDGFNCRDVASVFCACWAGVLGDQAVNVVGQDSGLTARTAIDQSPDYTRGLGARLASQVVNLSAILGNHALFRANG